MNGIRRQLKAITIIAAVLLTLPQIVMAQDDKIAVTIDARTQAACPGGVWAFNPATKTLTFYCRAKDAPK